MIQQRCSTTLWFLVLATGVASAWGCGKPVIYFASEVDQQGGAPESPGGRRPVAAPTPTGEIAGATFSLPDAAAAAVPPPPPPIEICATESRLPERPPVDLLFVVDASSSMLESVEGSTQSKWQLAQAAIVAFMRDPGSAGLQVGLQFFPLRAVCQSDRPVCLGPNNPPGPIPDCPCPGGLTCITAGRCAVTNQVCNNVGGLCGGGQPDNRCVVKHDCPGFDPSCTGADYRALAVPFGPLPANLPRVMTAIAATDPTRNSGTPTGVAVAAGLDVIRGQAATSGGRRVALVLVTDGEPTKCLPGDPPSGAARTAAIRDAVIRPVAEARLASPGTSVYAVGVFSQKDISMGFSSVVTDLAAAAGTTPFVVAANSDLTRVLVDAFNQIRTLTVPCEYTIPQPQQGVLDYGLVNVHLQSAAKDEDIPYVASASRCDAARGGWYYDADPATGAKPTRVVLCESACKGLQNDPRSKVDLRFGCKTRIIY